MRQLFRRKWLEDSDWDNIEKLCPGQNCVILKMKDGRIIQKYNEEINSRPVFWTGIKDIAISKLYSGVMIRLSRDGTCDITSNSTEYFKKGYHAIRDEVRSWNNIVQVAVSDAFFAIDKEGNVHYSGFDQFTDQDYQDVKTWQNIVKLVPGLQNSIFGITADGKVYATGYNCIKGPRGNINDRLKIYSDIIDVAPTGSECEEVVLLHKDGSISYVSNNTTPSSDLKFKKLDSSFWYVVVGLTEDDHLVYIMNYKDNIPFETPVVDGFVLDANFAVDGDNEIYAVVGGSRGYHLYYSKDYK